MTDPPDRSAADERVGLFAALVGDGTPLISVSGLILIFSGAFALFLASTGHLLPHDERYLGMTAEQLCSLHGCRIVHFMHHDRASFGGALIAIGALYLYLARFPLRRGEPWAWWSLIITGVVGFGSFLTYLGFGYLDTWHLSATFVLLACYAGGIWRLYARLHRPRHLRAVLRPSVRLPWKSRFGVGRALLLVTGLTLIAGGLTIMTVGMTRVFVPQDLTYMRIGVEELRAINPRLVPLIAHDRAGFGGGLCSVGAAVLLCVWCARPSKALWDALAVAGSAGFATAIAVHPVIGYNDLTHVGPAVVAATAFAVGLALTRGPMSRWPLPTTPATAPVMPETAAA